MSIVLNSNTLLMQTVPFLLPYLLTNSSSKYLPTLLTYMLKFIKIVFLLLHLLFSF